MIALSICIPTYNRRDLILPLVKSILEIEGGFEVCVHDDGSTDDTFEALSSIADNRLRLTSGPNSGRAHAIQKAVASSNGKFCMLFDDDDILFPSGLKMILSDCSEKLEKDCAGYIYHMSKDDGSVLGDCFPLSRVNLIKLRADYGISGDKKEVVLSDCLKSVMDVGGVYRRVPTSLYWARLSDKYDFMCVNSIVGQKDYLTGGMSSRIGRLKSSNRNPMILLHLEKIKLYVSGRYSSTSYFLKSVLALFWYLQPFHKG